MTSISFVFFFEVRVTTNIESWKLKTAQNRILEQIVKEYSSLDYKATCMSELKWWIFKCNSIILR